MALEVGGGGLCQGEEDDAKIGDRGVYWDGSGLSSGTECTYSTVPSYSMYC